MKKTKVLLLSLLLIFALALTACGGKTPPADSGSAKAEDDAVGVGTKVFKLGHIAAPGTAYDNFAHEFKRLIEERSEGRFEIDIYPAGQLGVDRELVESLQIGNVDFTVITASDINQFVPDMAVQDLPYLFLSWDHVEKFLASEAAEEFYAQTEGVGIKTLAFMPRGFRHVTSNIAPIYTPADLKGVKLRVAESEVYIDTFRALGANTQAMAWGEVFTALQQGTIDAHENTVVTTRDYKINEVQKYVSETGHFFAFAALQINSSLFNSMSQEDQAMIKAAGVEAAQKLGQVQKEDEASAKVELESLGMTFNEVTDKKEFEALMQPVYDKFFKNHDDKYFNIIKQLQ